MNSKTTIQEGQTLFDVSLQLTGSMEGVFLVMGDNGISSVNSNLEMGDEITYKQEVIDEKVVSYYEDRKLIINSGIEIVELPSLKAFSDGFNDGFN